MLNLKTFRLRTQLKLDLGVAQNATALSAYGDNLAATVKLTNCTIWDN